MNIHTKKGVSPLIATVLLIVFAIAIASILLSWLGGYTSDTTERAKSSSDATVACSKQGVDIVRVFADSSTKDIRRVDVQSTGQDPVVIKDILVSSTATTGTPVVDFAATDTTQAPGTISTYTNAVQTTVKCSNIDTIRVVTACGGVTAVVTGNSTIVGC